MLCLYKSTILKSRSGFRLTVNFATTTTTTIATSTAAPPCAMPPNCHFTMPVLPPLASSHSSPTWEMFCLSALLAFGSCCRSFFEVVYEMAEQMEAESKAIIDWGSIDLRHY
jgi:hypothetical protein